MSSPGLVEDKYWYYCFGGSWNEEVSLNQPYRYTAKPLDNEGGLNIYYYGARYFDADLGRFLALDPAASKYPSLSPYAYCANNPLKSVDVDGRDKLDVAAGAILAYLDDMAGGGTNLRSYWDPTDPRDYNLGQGGGDIGAFVTGAAAAIAGGASLGGEAVATVGTGGAAAIVMVPAASGSAALVATGVVIASASLSNLIMQKGRVQGGSEASKPHGNTANDSPATRYKMYDKEGNFQKHGVTQNPKTRYTKKELAGGKLVKQNEGPRDKMLKEERKLVEEEPGPLNHEPWAGKNKK